MNALELQGLTKHYKGFTLGPLDLTLPGGTICGLIGENGAGKSTTIRLILDMVQRDGGTVTILGRDSRTASVRAKEEIGVVLGSEGIPLCLNAVQAGKVMAGIYHNWDAAAYAELCQKFGLPDKKQYKDYSTGMKMKLCIAVALAHHPKLLLFGRPCVLWRGGYHDHLRLVLSHGYALLSMIWPFFSNRLACPFLT